jgi:SNF2 family DNA or RNA helicase
MDLATTDSMLELLLRLRQTSCHPQLVLNGLSRKYGVQPKPWTGHSSKHLHLIRMLESHRGEAALVFCQFTEEMDLLQTLLREHGFRSARLDGSLSNQERRLTLDRCRRPGEIEVCLIQIRAGGVGLNLQEFNRVYLTSPDWNPCNEIQAIARAHRMGQQRPVTVTKLVLSGVDATQPEGTAPQSMVDSRILDIQDRKRLLMSDLLGEPDLLHNGCRHRRARLTRSDWKRLLRTT